MTKTVDTKHRSAGRLLAGAAGWLAPLAAALAVGCVLAALDMLGDPFWAKHPMLGQAVGGVFLFIQGGLLLPKFLNYRDEQRQQKVSQLAYASLAQSANDAGRKLLAPLNGADLYALGIEAEEREPGCATPTASANRERLRRFGFDAAFTDTRGTWDDQRPQLEGRLVELLADQEFVRFLFRRVSRVRRELAAAAAQWAPTMFSDPDRTDDLEAFRLLIWDCQQLQRALRAGGILVENQPGWRPEPAFATSVTTTYWTFISAYERIRDDFDKKGVHERTSELGPAPAAVR